MSANWWCHGTRLCGFVARCVWLLVVVGLFPVVISSCGFGCLCLFALDCVVLVLVYYAYLRGFVCVVCWLITGLVLNSVVLVYSLCCIGCLLFMLGCCISRGCLVSCG